MRTASAARLARHRALPWRLPDRRACPPRRGPAYGNVACHRADAGALSRERVAAMSRTKNYVAVFDHDADEDVWLVHIRGVDGCQTYGRSIRQAEARIREALATWLDRNPDELTITPQLPDNVAALASQVSQARREAERAGTEAQQATADAVRRLTKMGLSRRDAADLLGISHQRVQQLLAS